MLKTRHAKPNTVADKASDTANPCKNKTAPLRHAARPRAQKRWQHMAGTYVNRTHPRRFARLATVLRTAEPTGAHPFPSAPVFYQTSRVVFLGRGFFSCPIRSPHSLRHILHRAAKKAPSQKDYPGVVPRNGPSTTFNLQGLTIPAFSYKRQVVYLRFYFCGFWHGRGWSLKRSR